MKVNINRSSFNKANEKNLHNYAEQSSKVSFKSTCLYVYLQDNSKYFIDFSAPNPFRIKKNTLYKGRFKKLGKIAYIQVEGE